MKGEICITFRALSTFWNYLCKTAQSRDGHNCISRTHDILEPCQSLLASVLLYAPSIWAVLQLACHQSYFFSCVRKGQVVSTCPRPASPDICFWSWVTVSESSNHEAAMLWGSPGHKRRLSVDALIGSPGWHPVSIDRSVNEDSPTMIPAPSQPGAETSHPDYTCLNSYPTECMSIIK